MMEALIPARWWPLGVGLRLAGLAAIVYGVAAASPGFGPQGRPLAGLVCTGLAAAGWLGWLVATTLVESRPVLVSALVILTVSGCVLAGLSPASPALALCGVGAFTAALTLAPVAAIAVVAVGIAGLGSGALIVETGVGTVAGYAAALAGITLAGFNRRQYQARLEQAELLVAQTRRAQQEQARAAALGERARIAREIHDVLAHSLGALAVQLDAADALLAEGYHLDQARDSVSRARRLAVDGLTETRRAIGALRGEALPLGELLTALTQQYQAESGTPAHVTVHGTRRVLPPEVALAGYRTAQEAVTNARKHAPGAPMSMELHYRQDELVSQLPTNPPKRSCPAGGRWPPPAAATG